MTHASHRTDEPIDRLLKQYFQAEVPNPWPASPLPVTTRPATGQSVRHSNGQRRARLTLAASIVLLLGFGYSMSSRVDDTRPRARDGEFLRTGVAGPSGLNKHINPNFKKTLKTETR